MKKKIILASMSLLLVMNACKEDLLDTTPYGQVTSQQYWRNGDDVVAATNAVYAPLLEEDGFAHTEYCFDNCSDDMHRAGDHSDETALELFTFDASNSHLLATWATKYEVISRANAVLINAPKVDMDETLRNKSMGEAYFLRGFVYWRLSLIYGEVPILLEEDAINLNFNKPKSSFEEVRAQAEADFLKAAELLPVSHAAVEAGRVTQGSANGFLAKLYVYNEDWAKAIEYADKVIGNGAYVLADNFNENFELETENNPEVLFALQYETGWTADNSPAFYHTPQAYGGWGFHEPIEDLVEEFEEGDPRRAYSIYAPGDPVTRGSQGTEPFEADMTRVTGYAFRKYSAYTDAGDMSQSLNAPFLRVADVYLLAAEAKIRSGQNGDVELNKVRARAGLHPIAGASIEDIMHERRVELAGENERHQDLMRWDKGGILDISAHYSIDRGPYKPGRNFVKPKHYYFPLPQREVDLSNGVLVQNPNY